MATPVGPSDEELVREAEVALRDLGFPRARSSAAPAGGTPAFWVESRSARRRSIPVYVGRVGGLLPSMMPPATATPDAEADLAPTILVVPTDAAAESAWSLVPQNRELLAPAKIRILVLRDPGGTSRAPHWHLVTVPPTEVLRLATGIVVGMYRRAFAGEGAGDVDFAELLGVLRAQYHVDVQKSLGVQSDEDALFVLYHLALRDSFAPGNIAGNLHSIVANPTGPASRVPWFAG